MSELSDDSKEKRRESNRKKDDAKKNQKSIELAMLEDKEVSQEKKTELLTKHNQHRAKSASRTRISSNKTGHKTP